MPSRDAGAFTAAVLRYRGDREALAAASRSAARFTARTYSWTGVAERFVEIFRERIGGPPAKVPVPAAGVR